MQRNRTNDRGVWHKSTNIADEPQSFKMTSCQPDRTSAYSDDLRWRMIWQREGLELTFQQIATNLCVDKSTVCRTVQRFRTVGSVMKKTYPKDKASRRLTKPAQLFILNIVLQKPGIYLHEIRDELINTLLVCVSISTICKFLYKSGFTRRKLGYTAIQQDQLLREQFASDVSVFTSDMFVFVDETGTDQRNTLRKYGYTLRGKELKEHTLLVRGVRITAIACISKEGLLDVKTLTGTTDGDSFYDFLHTHLLPHLQPYNGENPHSIVVLDNCSIHHIHEVTQVIHSVGALVIFLPPYSPDFNPIEEAFSKVKTSLKSLSLNQFDIETLVLLAFQSITSNDCMGWISHCGIYQ